MEIERLRTEGLGTSWNDTIFVSHFLDVFSIFFIFLSLRRNRHGWSFQELYSAQDLHFAVELRQPNLLQAPFLARRAVFSIRGHPSLSTCNDEQILIETALSSNFTRIAGYISDIRQSIQIQGHLMSGDLGYLTAFARPGTCAAMPGDPEALWSIYHGYQGRMTLMSRRLRSSADGLLRRTAVALAWQEVTGWDNLTTDNLVLGFGHPQSQKQSASSSCWNTWLLLQGNDNRNEVLLSHWATKCGQIFEIRLIFLDLAISGKFPDSLDLDSS